MGLLQLCLSKDHQWLMFLKENNYEEAREFLKSQDDAEKERLVNGRFSGTDKHGTIPGQDHLKTTSPWCIAVIHCSYDILELLYQ